MSIWRRLWLPFQEITSSIYNNNQNDETHDIKIIKIPGTTKAATSPDSQSSDENNKIQLIIDDPAEEDALDFQRYSQNLANIIRTTKPKFAVGIFGKWGTGKSTLMRMIERELNPVLILTWNGITQ
jgi:ABC-type bacteriocin/lantibiotic exporter with double-glycine peptidase domain